MARSSDASVQGKKVADEVVTWAEHEGLRDSFTQRIDECKQTLGKDIQSTGKDLSEEIKRVENKMDAAYDTQQAQLITLQNSAATMTQQMTAMTQQMQAMLQPINTLVIRPLEDNASVHDGHDNDQVHEATNYQDGQGG